MVRMPGRTIRQPRGGVVARIEVRPCVDFHWSMVLAAGACTGSRLPADASCAARRPLVQCDAAGGMPLLFGNHLIPADITIDLLRPPLRRLGTACPGHLNKHQAAPDGPDEPGQDVFAESPRRFRKSHRDVFARVTRRFSQSHQDVFARVTRRFSQSHQDVFARSHQDVSARVTRTFPQESKVTTFGITRRTGLCGFPQSPC
jgi:hypothetical protein